MQTNCSLCSLNSLLSLVLCQIELMYLLFLNRLQGKLSSRLYFSVIIKNHHGKTVQFSSSRDDSAFKCCRKYCCDIERTLKREGKVGIYNNPLGCQIKG